jgi:glucosamine 6-phosphate synthetase-like amidotransferase/phosphosugar isomerase protein
MDRNMLSIPQEEDCFFRMKDAIDNDGNKVNSKMGILHSRYASHKLTIKQHLAHPLFDEKNRVAVFHNGFIANYEDLSKELKQMYGMAVETDSQLIAKLIGV